MALVIERFYWLPHCSTCQKAEQFLKEKGAKILQYIDVKTQKVSAEEIQDLATRLGSVEALFSKRALKYRAWGLNEKVLTDEEMLGYMHQEYTFIKRPVLLTKTGKVLAGFSAKQYQGLMG